MMTSLLPQLSAVAFPPDDASMHQSSRVHTDVLPPTASTPRAHEPPTPQPNRAPAPQPLNTEHPRPFPSPPRFPSLLNTIHSPRSRSMAQSCMKLLGERLLHERATGTKQFTLRRHSVSPILLSACLIFGLSCVCARERVHASVLWLRVCVLACVRSCSVWCWALWLQPFRV